MSRVKKIATLTFGQGINVLVNFLFMPYMARVLSYDECRRITKSIVFPKPINKW